MQSFKSNFQIGHLNWSSVQILDKNYYGGANRWVSRSFDPNRHLKIHQRTRGDRVAATRLQKGTSSLGPVPFRARAITSIAATISRNILPTFISVDTKTRQWQRGGCERRRRRAEKRRIHIRICIRIVPTGRAWVGTRKLVIFEIFGYSTSKSGSA